MVFNALGLPVTQCPLGFDRNQLPIGLQVTILLQHDYVIVYEFYKISIKILMYLSMIINIFIILSLYVDHRKSKLRSSNDRCGARN